MGFTVKIGTLPPGAVYDAQTYAQAIADRMDIQSTTTAAMANVRHLLGTQTSQCTAVPINDDGVHPAVHIIMSDDLTIDGSNLSNINAQNGLVMDFWLENASGDSSKTYKINMPDVVWPNGIPPVLSSGVIGQRVIDHIRVQRVGGIELGELVAKNYHVPLG